MRLHSSLLVLAVAPLTLAATAVAAPAWQVVPAPGAGSTAGLNATSFDAPADGWAVGSRGTSLERTGLDTLTERWDGRRWRIVPSPGIANSDEVLTGVSAVGPDDAWAVGWHDPYGTTRAHGLVLHWTGLQWSTVQDEPHSPIPVAVSARSASDVWVVGNDLIEHFDGSSWRSLTLPETGIRLQSVTALAADDVWAAGNRDDPRPGYHHGLPYLAHWDGTSWSSVTSPYDANVGGYSSVSAVSPSDIWVVGTLGSQSATPVSVHFDGTQWAAVAMPGPGAWDRLSGVAAAGTDDVWAVGSTNGSLPNGFAVLRTFVEHWNGRHWSVVASPNDTDADNYFTAVATPGGAAWAVGGDGNTLVARRGR